MTYKIKKHLEFATTYGVVQGALTLAILLLGLSIISPDLLAGTGAIVGIVGFMLLLASFGIGFGTVILGAITLNLILKYADAPFLNPKGIMRPYLIVFTGSLLISLVMNPGFLSAIFTSFMSTLIITSITIASMKLLGRKTPW